MAVQPFVRLRADEAVYEDAGTNPCEDGEAVVRWGFAAASAQTGYAEQTVGARQPVWNASDGGYASITFTSDVMCIAHSAPWAGWTGISFLCAVYAPTLSAASNGRHLWGFGGVGWTAAGLLWATGMSIGHNASWYSSLYNNGERHSVIDANPGMWLVMAGTASATEHRAWVNRQSIVRNACASAVAVGTQVKCIGATGDATTYAIESMKMREIAWWDSQLTEVQMNTEVDDAMTRWGITNDLNPPAEASSYQRKRVQAI